MARALQVISTGGMYGAERVLLELSRFLNDNGWDSQILAIDGAGAAPLVAAARRMGMRAELFGERDIGAWSGAKRLASYLEEHSIDLVHSHGYKPDILLAASGQPRRRVCVATCHSWYSDTLKMRAYEWLDKRCLRFFDQVVAVSDEILQDLLGNAVSAMRLSMISNGLDAIQPADQARLVIRRQLEVGPEELLVVRVGRLMATKGNDLLLRALASLNRSDWRLAFVGAGDQQPVLEALAASLDVAAKVR
ncbi:MAG: glycosyltransferase, partial [Pseudomonadales bacterium]|nr:glycosyltransferase [Pseudomonadales bacterium]